MPVGVCAMPPEGRACVPGHAIECMWFLINLFEDRGETENIQKCCDIIRRHIELGLDKEKGGLFLAPSAKEKPQVAEVVAVGPGGMVEGVEVPMFLKVGDKVIVGKYTGTQVKVGSEEYTIVRQSDVLAVVAD